MKKRNVAFILFLSIFFISLNAQRIKSSVFVTQLLPDQEILPNSVVYYLPKTFICIDIKAEKCVYREGLFRVYSEDMLNISPVINKDSISWEIKEISIRTKGVADKAKKYSIVATGDASAQFVSLTADSRLLGLNIPEKCDNDTSIVHSIEKEISFNDVTFNDVPFLEKQLKTTSLPAMASSAAEMVYKLRKRQLKLAGFEYDHHPTDAEHLKYTLESLKKQETIFTELFIGKCQTQSIVKSFCIDPFAVESGGKMLFYFSNTKGFVDSDDQNSESYTIRFKEFDEDLITNKEQKKINKGLVYNIPVTVDCSIIKDSSEVFSSQVQLAKFGNTADVSPKIIIQKNISIELDDKTGALKSIKRVIEK